MNRFKELRESRKEADKNCSSIAALGKALGIDRSNVSRIESGVMSPSLNILRRYHEYFGVSIEYLLGEEKLKEKAATTADRADDDMKIWQQADESATLAPENRVRAKIDEIFNSKTLLYQLLKQTTEFLYGTGSGLAVLSEIADVMFGIKTDEYPDKSIMRDENTMEFKRTHKESIENESKKLSDKFVMLKDPKYRRMSYNEIKVFLINMENEK